MDRTLVTIPNGKLSEMQIESYSARDRMRFACTIGLVYETTASQMREILEGFERVLREHPSIWPETVVVRFKEFGASSLDIEVADSAADRKGREAGLRIYDVSCKPFGSATGGSAQ